MKAPQKRHSSKKGFNILNNEQDLRNEELPVFVEVVEDSESEVESEPNLVSLNTSVVPSPNISNAMAREVGSYDKKLGSVSFTSKERPIEHDLKASIVSAIPKKSSFLIQEDQLESDSGARSQSDLSESPRRDKFDDNRSSFSRMTHLTEKT